METIKNCNETFQAKDGSVVTLREVQKEDAVKIVSAAQSIVKAGKYIQKELVRSVKEEEIFIESMISNNNMYTAIVRQDKVVGIARVMRGELSMKQHTGVFRTWIIDEAQGLGIGNFIMKSTINWGKQSGLHKIWLTVFASNQGAYHLYKKHGFVEEGTQKDQVLLNDQWDDEIFMAYFFK